MSTLTSLRRQGASAYAVATLLLFLAASSALTPLYRVYQVDWGISSFTITAIFAVYAGGLLAALLTVGSLSDFLGRRPVIVASLMIEALAMLLIATAKAPGTLILARLLQGIATGAAASTLGAMIMDTCKVRGALINSAAPPLGTAMGVLCSSVAFARGPEPAPAFFTALFGLCVVLALFALVVTETGARVPGALASLRPKINVPLPARKLFWATTPVFWAVWALTGFYLSLMPSLLHVTSGSTSPMLGGLAAGVLTLSGATAILLLHRLPASRIFLIGTWGLIAGAAFSLGGVALHSIPLLMGGTVVGGAGFGTAYFGGLRRVLPLADETDRAALLAAIYTQCYLAFSLPAVAVGLAVPFIGLPLASYLYGTVIILLAAGSLLMGARSSPRMVGINSDTVG
jgi:MFS family permease